MKSWSRPWILGWIIILSVAVVYELTAFAFELSGITTFPTLSTIIVTIVSLWILVPLTLLIALVLVWHWFDLKSRLHQLFQTTKVAGWAAKVRGRLRLVWDQSAVPGDDEILEEFSGDFVTRDKRR